MRSHRLNRCENEMTRTGGLLFVGAVPKDKRLLYGTAIGLMGIALLLSGSTRQAGSSANCSRISSPASSADLPFTNSQRAQESIEKIESGEIEVIKVIPVEYRKMQQRIRYGLENSHSLKDAELKAFNGELTIEDKELEKMNIF